MHLPMGKPMLAALPGIIGGSPVFRGLLDRCRGLVAVTAILMALQASAADSGGRLSADANPVDARTSGTSSSPPSDVIISGPDGALAGHWHPNDFVEWVVSWQGGEPPWTVELVASDAGTDRVSTATITSESVCTSEGFETGCGTWPLGLFTYVQPQLSDVTATVTDVLGRSAAVSQRIRVGTEDDPIFIRNPLRMDVREDPESPGDFLCLPSSPDDPVYLDVYGHDQFPTFNWTSDPWVAAPYWLHVHGQHDWGDNFDFVGLAYGIADEHWTGSSEPPEGEDIELEFPLEYGDYDSVDTMVYGVGSSFEPQVPSPPLLQGVRYTARVPTPFECTDGLGSRSMDFYVNPPLPGDPVIASEGGGSVYDGQFLERKQSLAAKLRAKLEAELRVREDALVGCMNDAFTSVIALQLLNGRGFAEPTDLILESTALANLELFTGFCEERYGTSDLAAARATEPLVFEFELVDGYLQLEIVEPRVEIVLTTENAEATVQGESRFIARHSPGGTSRFAAIDQAITVQPLAPPDAEPVILEPGYILDVDADGAAEPVSEVVFGDSFEN